MEQRGHGSWRKRTRLARRVCMAILLAWAAWAGGLAQSAHAQTLPTLPPPAAPASSTATLAAQLARALFKGPPVIDGARLAFAVTREAGASGVAPSGATPPGPDLSAFLADALEAAMRAGPVAGSWLRVREADPATRVDERIELELAVREGHLVVTARRRALPKNVWEAMSNRAGEVVATAYANVSIDLELRTLLGLGRREVRLDDLRLVPVGKKSVATLGTARVLDCLVADLDQDRRPELVVLQPDTVRVLRWAEGGLSQELGSYSLRTLGPAEAKLREPLGRLVLVTRADGRQVVVAASSDRSEPAVLGYGPGGFDRLALLFQKGWPLYATGVDSFVVGPWPSGIDTLEGGLTEAKIGTAGAAWLGGASKVYDVRAAAGDGRGMVVAALAGGRLRLVGAGLARSAAGDGRPRGARPASMGSGVSTVEGVDGVGVAAAMIDFDGDGLFELVTTSAGLGPGDRLALARGTNLAKASWSAGVGGVVTALCGGDVDRDGFGEVFAATWSGSTGEVYVAVPK